LDVGVNDVAEQSPKSYIDVYLRTQHVEYIEQVAREEDTSFSAAFAIVLQRYAEALRPSPGRVTRRLTRKARKHLPIDPEHLAMLDGLAVQHGVSRSDISRRLIGEVIEAERRPLVAYNR